MDKVWNEGDLKILKTKYNDLTNKELSKVLKRSVPSIEKKLSRLGLKREVKEVDFSGDIERFMHKAQKRDVEKKYKVAMEANILLNKQIEFITGLRENYNTTGIYQIKSPKHHHNEATALVLAGDWHCEEIIERSQINGLNEFNLEIFQKRVTQLSIGIVKMIRILRKDIPIPKMIIHLIGDFFNGNIQDDYAENNATGFMDAGIIAMNAIASMLAYIQTEIPDIEITCVCSIGNHSRITKKKRISTAAKNSLETFMYYMLQDKFPKIKFLIDGAYHKYIKVYDYMCRFHHGDWISYSGGVGGIFISAYKSIAQWNKGIKADYDFFGHFHTMKDGANFLCNGSLVGHNEYAVSIKADYEIPKQTICLIDKKRGKTVVAPIILD